MTGVVVQFDDQHGFGFIRLADGRDIYVHRSQLLNELELRAGQRVQFETSPHRQGPRAVRVLVVS